MIPLRVPIKRARARFPYSNVRGDLLRGYLHTRRRRRRHPVGCVIHVDVVTQMAVVENERSLRKFRPMMPEYIDVTDSILRPHIKSGPVTRRGL